MLLGKDVNSEVAAKLVARVEEAASMEGVDIRRFNLSKRPVIFNAAVAMSIEGSLLLWSLAGCPGPDGMPVQAMLRVGSAQSEPHTVKIEEAKADEPVGKQKDVPAQPPAEPSPQEASQAMHVDLEGDDSPKGAKRANQGWLSWGMTSFMGQPKKLKLEQPHSRLLRRHSHSAWSLWSRSRRDPQVQRRASAQS